MDDSQVCDRVRFVDGNNATEDLIGINVLEDVVHLRVSQSKVHVPVSSKPVVARDEAAKLRRDRAHQEGRREDNREARELVN